MERDIANGKKIYPLHAKGMIWILKLSLFTALKAVVKVLKNTKCKQNVAIHVASGKIQYRRGAILNLVVMLYEVMFKIENKLGKCVCGC